MTFVVGNGPKQNKTKQNELQTASRIQQPPPETSKKSRITKQRYSSGRVLLHETKLTCRRAPRAADTGPGLHTASLAWRLLPMTPQNAPRTRTQPAAVTRCWPGGELMLTAADQHSRDCHKTYTFYIAKVWLQQPERFPKMPGFGSKNTF